MNKTIPLFLLLIVPLLAGSCKQKAQQEEASTYKLFTVRRTNHTLQTRYPATLRGRQAVEVRPQVSGTITQILINEGAVVQKGQLLFVIDQVPYRAALMEAEANLKSARARLRQAKLDADSREQLHKEGVVSRYDLLSARSALDEARASVQQAEAALVQAKNNLSYTEVKSPVSGVASMTPWRVGALVSSSMEEPLVTVSDDAEVYAYFSMAENEMLNLMGQYGSLEDAKAQMPPVALLLSNGERYAQSGRINAIGGTVDEGTGTVGLRAAFPNPRHLLRHGASATVIVPTTLRNCIVIPQSATYEQQERVFAWKVVNGKTQSAPLQVYKYNDGRNYVVLSGLKEGDVIIAEGAGLVREDTPVNTQMAQKSK